MKLKIIIASLYLIMSSTVSFGSACDPFTGINMSDDNAVENALEHITFDGLKTCSASSLTNTTKKLSQYIIQKKCPETNFMIAVQTLYDLLIQDKTVEELFPTFAEHFLYRPAGRTPQAVPKFFQRVFMLLLNAIKQNLSPSQLSGPQKQKLKDLCKKYLYTNAPTTGGFIGALGRRRGDLTGNKTPLHKAIYDQIVAAIDSKDFKASSHLMQAYVRPISNAIAASNTQIPELQNILQNTSLKDLEAPLKAYQQKHTEFIADNTAEVLAEFRTILTPKIGIAPHNNPLSDDEVTALCTMIGEALHVDAGSLAQEIIDQRNETRKRVIMQLQASIRRLNDATAIPADIHNYDFLTPDVSFAKLKQGIIETLTNNEQYKALVDQLSDIFEWSPAQKQAIISTIETQRAENQARAEEQQRQREAAEKADNERQEKEVAEFMVNIPAFIDSKNINQTYNFDSPFASSLIKQFNSKIKAIIEKAQEFMDKRIGIARHDNITGSHRTKLINDLHALVISKLTEETGNKAKRIELINKQFERYFPRDFTAS